MLTTIRSRFPVCVIGLSLLGSLLAVSVGRAEPAVERDKLPGFAAEALRFDPFVFSGNKFPTCSFERPAEVEKLIGPYTLKTSYYDAEGKEVAAPHKAAGRYAAVVEIHHRGRVSKRFFTLFHLDGNARLNNNDLRGTFVLPTPGDIEPDVGNAQAEDVERYANQVIGKALVREPAGAALLAGLHDLSQARRAGKEVADDRASARERQWWVNFKRKYYGYDKSYPQPFVCPVPLKGKPAPIVREGSLPEAGMKADALDTIDAACSAWARENGNGFGMCVIRRGVVVLNRGYGQSQGKPVTADSPGVLASVTKFLGAILMLEMVDQGIVRLDDPVERHVAALRGIKVARSMTIRDLYLHTCGFSTHSGDTWPDLEEIVADMYPALEVGARHQYQGTGHALGSKLMESISGEALPYLYQNHLFGPLGCRHTYADLSSFGSKSIPLDLGRIGQMMLNGGSYGDKRFFSPKTLQLMLPVDGKDRIGPEPSIRWGLGIKQMDDDSLSPRAFGHSGGSGSFLIIDPERELVITHTRLTEGNSYKEFLKQKSRVIGVIVAAIAPEAKKSADKQGDPLPAGASGRLGTIRFRHGDQINAVAYSPDGKLIASGGRDGSLALWNAESGAEVRWSRGLGPVFALTFSPDGKRLAVAGRSKVIRVYDVSSGVEMLTCSGHEGPVLALAFAPDGSLLASGSEDRALIFWDARSGKKLRTASEHEADVTALAWAPDGNTIASGSKDQKLRLWDAATAKLQQTVPGHTGPVTGVVFASDGKTIYSGSLDKTIRAWDRTGKARDSWIAHNGGVVGITISPDGKYLAAGGNEDSVTVWALESRKKVQTCVANQGRVTAVAFGLGNQQVCSVGHNGTLRLWRVDTGADALPFAGHYAAVSSLAFTGDGTHLASCGFDGSVRLWDVRQQQQVRAFEGHRNVVLALALAPDSKTLATASRDKTLRLWDVASAKPNHVCTGHEGWVTSIAWSPDGKVLLSGGDDQTVRCWDPVTGKLERTLKEHAGPVRAVCFTPDGSLFASGGDDQAIYLWETKSGTKVRTCMADMSGVTALAFSPDGLVLASGHREPKVRLWDVRTGKLLRTCTGARSGARGVEFSRDGKSLYVINDDGSLEAWDAAEAKKLCCVVGHRGTGTCLSLSPDEELLATGSADKTVLLWHLPLDRQPTR
jgi:WD40 repeat protein/CubicO group peptidase (beta-lactamase class C family)